MSRSLESVGLLAAALVAAFGCGFAAARLGRAAGESRATALTRGALGAFGAVVVVEEALGAAGVLGARATALALGAAWLVLAWLARGVPREASPSVAPWTPLEAGLAASLAAALVLRAFDGAHRTTFLYDTLSYHLHAPATWLRDGRLSIVPAVFGDPAPAYAPSNVELVFALLMAPTRSGALAQAGQAPLAALACAAVAAAVREAGGARAAALAAALAFLLVPEVWQQSTSAMTDVGAAAFLLAALPFAVRLAARKEEADARDAAFLGLAAGLCAGAKVTGAVLVTPILVAACARAARPRLWFALAGGVALGGAYFYARNLIVTGNPLYPLALTLGGHTLAPGVYDAAVLRASAYHVARGDLAALGRLLLEPGLAFALAGATALVLGARARPPWTALALVLIALFWLVLPYQESRFLFPLWGVAAVALGTFARKRPATARDAWTWAPLALAVVGSVVEHPTGERWAVLGVGLIAALGARTLTPTLSPSGRGRWMLMSAVAVAIVVGLGRGAEPAYGVGDGLDEAWAWARANVRGARVAYTGNNLPFPLAGDGLANDVRYVNVAGAPGDLLHDLARRARAAPAGPEPAPYREGARYEDWRANLRATRREVLFVAALYPEVRATIAADADGFPIERAWADAHPDTFALRFASPAARVYGVAP